MKYSFTYIMSATKAIWFFFVRKFNVEVLLGRVLISQRSSRSRKRWALLIFCDRDLRPPSDACARKWRHLATCDSATCDHCRPGLTAVGMDDSGTLSTNAFTYTNLATFERLLQKFIHEHPTVVRIRNFSNEIHRVDTQRELPRH